ncbi:MAG TPA: hypothetical protein VII57_01905 [Dehalococcoidia bacterium]
MPAMTSWSEFEGLVEWREVEGVSTLLRETCEATKLAPEMEWVLEVVKETAALLPASIIEGRESEYLAEYILGVNAARNALIVATYCFDFLRGEGLMDAGTANRVEERLAELETKLASLTDTLRRNLSLRPVRRRFSNN